MAVKSLPEGNVQTPKFRVAFPYLFKPRPSDKPGKDPRFEIVMLFPKDSDISALKKACEAVMSKKFGEDRTKWPKSYKKPFRDGDEFSHLNGYAGCTFVSAWSKNPVGIVDEKCQIITGEDGMYPGCYARAIVAPFWFDREGNKGIAFFLNGVQRLEHGERLIARPKPEEMFQEVASGANDENEPF